jgi:hypothetical protein
MPQLELYVEVKNEGHRQTLLGIEKDHVQRRQGQLMQSLVALGADSGVSAAQVCLGPDELDDDSRYFLANTRRITKPNYNPTKKDESHFRAMYDGATELAFSVGELTYNVCGVGGQRMDMSKWSHHMLDVTGIVFVASLVDYDVGIPDRPSFVSDSQQNLICRI